MKLNVIKNSECVFVGYFFINKEINNEKEKKITYNRDLVLQRKMNCNFIKH